MLLLTSSPSSCSTGPSSSANFASAAAAAAPASLPRPRQTLQRRQRQGLARRHNNNSSSSSSSSNKNNNSSHRSPRSPWLARVLCTSALLQLQLSAPIAEAAKAKDKYVQAAKQGRKQGLKGYDLVDKLDFFYGRDTPPFGHPVRVIDALGDQDHRATREDFEIMGIPLEHFDYFDKNKDGEFSDDEAMWWFMQRKGVRDMNLDELKNPPKGHMGRIGSWKDPLPSEHLIYHKPYPHPRDFWKKHMDGYLPAMLKGAQKGQPCMNWTREVLAERFGWVEAKLEPKVEGRNNDTAYKDLDKVAPKHRLNVSEYLKHEKDKNIYVVSILPQEMAWEVAHPSVLLCGSRRVMVDRTSKPPYRLTKHDYPHESGYNWMTHLFETNFWIASGRTRSQFHYDKEWNVNCLLSGTKRWFFLNPFDYHDQVQWARGNKFKPKNPLNNAWTDWVYLEPDSVDLIVQNKLRNMDYYEMVQEAGDCLFLPYAMLHQVEKIDKDLQVAVSWMFLPETVYNEEDCADAPLDEDLPLAAMDTLYMYTGKGLIPQGYADPLNFLNEVDQVMVGNKAKHLSLQLFTEIVSQEDAILASGKGRKARIRKIYEMLNKYASQPYAGLTREELHKVPLRLWCKPAAEGDKEGPLPCDRGEEYHICDDKEYEKMDSYVKERLKATGKKIPEKKDVIFGTIPETKRKDLGPAPPRLWKKNPEMSNVFAGATDSKAGGKSAAREDL